LAKGGGGKEPLLRAEEGGKEEKKYHVHMGRRKMIDLCWEVRKTNETPNFGESKRGLDHPLLILFKK
jgi:hypothetical protein